ncbi:MAG: anaerobic ribonucleoside-triphosphate reductase activating protein [Oscillospiraceae bacterium]
MSSTAASALRIAGTVQDSIVDGPGLRFAVFTQGCPHRCPGCHNPSTHDPEAGAPVSVSALIDEMRSSPLTGGLTLSGGEPFLQAEACIPLARAARESGLTVWVYTGYCYEALCAKDAPEAWHMLLQCADVLVDGPFVLEQRSLSLPFRGSANQRLIDLPKSRLANNVVLWAPSQPSLPLRPPEG